MTELKPCPFCGNPAMMLKGTDGGYPYIYVICGSCGVSTPYFFLDEEDRLRKVKDIAAKAWNRRAEQ